MAIKYRIARLYTGIVPVEVDVTEKLERARRQIAAGRIENRVVIGKGHVFEPTVDHVLVEGGPAAIATLEAQLPGQSALEQIFVAVLDLSDEPAAAPSAPSRCRRCPDNKRYYIRRPSRWLRDADCFSSNRPGTELLCSTTTQPLSAARDARPGDRIRLAR